MKPHTQPVGWWMTDPTGPVFEAALRALKTAYGRDAAAIGCGGTIGFVGPLADLFNGAPALLLGIEDPESNAHAPNESLHEGDCAQASDGAGAALRKPWGFPPSGMKPREFPLKTG